jgi:hypothetical protein
MLGQTALHAMRLSSKQRSLAVWHLQPAPASISLEPAALPRSPAAPPNPPCTVKCSQGNQPRVLPAVVRYLSDAGYKFDSEESNHGVINVAIGC